MEASIVERLRRSSDCNLHQELVHAPLIYGDKGRKALKRLYQEYVDIAIESSIPILLCTPTWRANRLRVQNSDVTHSLNVDAVHFLKDFRDSQLQHQIDIKIGGLIGCKNDCYKPDEGLSASEAQTFHIWQVQQLVLGDVDFLIAETLPHVEEALGIAKAMETTRIPYIISFVISRNGRVLDGTNLIKAIQTIDSQTRFNPLGYMINCAYPSFICPEIQPRALFERLIGYLANASSLDQCDLDGSVQLEMESIAEWGDLMVELNKKYGVKILGGCCGTHGDHLRYITRN